MFASVLPSMESLEFMKAVATSNGITMQVPKAAGKAMRRYSPIDLLETGF